MKTAENTELVKPSALAKLLGVTPVTIRKWAHAGLIPCVKIGTRIIRYSVAEVMTALRSQAT